MGVIAAAEGLSVSMVRKLARTHGVAIVPKPHGPRPDREAEALSPLAQRVGRRICRWRDHQNGYGFREAAAIVGMTLPRFMAAEAGACALTLPEIERLSAALGMPPSELLA
ncbi:hypothetical protein WV31_02815 [Magnetospirillum sp. ME-1]|nr:hypothetical protein WV31_02815 [Magnetospirillum sp. ME-1]